jgi:hypothetical protein
MSEETERAYNAGFVEASRLLGARLAEAERLLGEVYREEFEDRGMTPRVCAIALWFGNRHPDSANADQPAACNCRTEDKP